MKKLLLISILMISLSGCAWFQPKTYVLTESEEYFYVPANTVINAQIGDKMFEVKRSNPSWNVEAGYLAKLQEQANANTLKGGK